MSTTPFSLIELPWLPRTAPDFRDRLAAAQAGDRADWDRELRILAGQFLGLNQASALYRVVERMRASRKAGTLARFRLAVVSNGTSDLLPPFLVSSALRHGILLDVIRGDFGQVVQDALDPYSQINASKPDAVLLAIDYRGLPMADERGAAWPAWRADAALEQLRGVREGFRRNCGALCLVQTIPAPPSLLFGSLEVGLAGTPRAAVAELNRRLIEEVVASGDVIVDIDWLAQSVGLAEWYDDRHWYLSRLPFSNRVLPLYADFVTRIVAALRGKARKCLILDLDNTLWGGVIGDDGMEGIALNEGDGRGEAFRSIQAVAADLRRRGVVLAVCSKNDEVTARLPFQSHPGMILRESDIAVFMANWRDKASNIEQIARQLELGLDAMVLLDDNPAEREQVRAALPDVAVPELGADPSFFARTLLAAGYFESVAFTAEDLARAEQYRSNAGRTQLLESSRDLGEFLRSLDMRVSFAPFDATGRKRITQLINKTNQFNVTTRRYTEAQIAAMESDPTYMTLQIGVRDRFGDNGMISVVICRSAGTDWEIDTWLMSCRVLNRRIEEAVCNRLVEQGRRAGASRIVGIFIPTERNGVSGDLYRRLGFQSDGTVDGSERWVLAIAGYSPFDVPATVG